VRTKILVKAANTMAITPDVWTRIKVVARYHSPRRLLLPASI
jgi:hypothetical protein